MVFFNAEGAEEHDACGLCEFSARFAFSVASPRFGRWSKDDPVATARGSVTESISLMSSRLDDGVSMIPVATARGSVTESISLMSSRLDDGVSMIWLLPI